MDEWSKVWNYLSQFLTMERGSLVIAIAALGVSIYSVVVSKRGVAAAERSAEAASGQAESSAQQALEASSQASIARQQAEIGALITAQSRIDEWSPDVAVAIASVDSAPRLAYSAFDVAAPHPPSSRPEEPVLINVVKHGHHDLYFTIKGTLSAILALFDRL